MSCVPTLSCQPRRLFPFGLTVLGLVLAAAAVGTHRAGKGVSARDQRDRRVALPTAIQAAQPASPPGDDDEVFALVDEPSSDSEFSDGSDRGLMAIGSGALEVSSAGASASAAAAPENFVLLGTADGKLHAVDTRSGRIKWAISGGPLLATSSGDGEIAFLPDLSDGTLYYTDRRTNEVRRLSKTVQQLASGPAILAGDGNIYIGEKRSTVYAVDPTTGAARGHFLATVDAMQPDATIDGAILIGRTEYTLVVRRAKTGTVAWNMTLAEYTSPLIDRAKQLRAFTPSGDGTFVIEADGGGSVMKCVDHDSTGQGEGGGYGTAATLWEQRFGSPAVSMYGATSRGGFQRLLFAPSHQRGRSAIGIGATDSTEEGALISVLRTQSGLLYASSLGGQSAMDSDSSLSVYNPDFQNGYRGQLEVSPVPLLVGAEPHALPYIATDNPTAPPGMDPSRSEPAPSYTLLLFTVGLTAAVTATMVWFLRPRDRPSSPPARSSAPKESSDHSAAPTNGVDVGGTGADSPSPAEAAVAEAAAAPALPREVPIEGGEAGSIRLGKIDVLLNQLLGRGSLGTLVYKGRYDGHEIAVKRMLKEYYELAMHEVDLLLRSDDHPNVIRYFAKEEGPEFLYIGLELCVGTIVHVVDGPDAATGPIPGEGGLTVDMVKSLDRKRLAHEMLSGLLHLHELQVVHRDLKPQNVLLTHRLTAVISDFGLCKALHDGQSSFHTERVGTQGWVAPELLKKNGGRITRAIDVFAAGCVVHYLFSGKHPFGEYYEREKNIRARKPTIKSGDVLIDSLVQLMIRPKPERRVSTARALAHPFFWPLSKRLTFLMDTSDRLETEGEGSALLVRFEQDGSRAIGGPDWIALVGDEFRKDLRRFRTYQADRVVDLLRAIRNKRHHYGELPPELKAVLGSVPNGYMEYFQTRFPQLLLHVYRFVTTTECVDEPLFAPYFAV